MKYKTCLNIGGKNLVSLSNLYIIGLVLLPILNGYQVFSMKFLDFFNILVCLIVFIKRRRISVNMCFFPYIIYTLFSIIIMTIPLNSVTTEILIKNIISYSILIVNFYFIAPSIFDTKKAYKIYTKVVVSFTVIGIIQFLVNQIFSIRTILILPFAKLNYGGDMLGTTYIRLLKESYESYRVSTFFLEPSFMAEYLVVWIFISLFNYKEVQAKRRLILIAFVTLATCLTTSSLGIGCCLIAWGSYILKYLRAVGKDNTFFLVPIIILGAMCLYNIEAVQQQILKQLYSLQDITYHTSLSVRLFRGFYCFRELEPLNQLFGCGYSLIYQFFTEHNIRTVLDRVGDNITVMNGISLMLCSVGIMGTLLYIIPLFRIIIRNRSLLMLLMCWILLMFTTQAYDMPTLLLLTIFIFKLSYSQKDRFLVVEY